MTGKNTIAKVFISLLLSFAFSFNSVFVFASTPSESQQVSLNQFLAPASFMSHTEDFYLKAYHGAAMDLLKKQGRFAKVFSRYNHKKIKASIYMFKSLNTGLRRLVKLNKFMAKAYDTTDPAFYASSTYRDYRTFLKDTTKILAEIRDVFGSKEMTFSYQELFGDKKGTKGLIDRMVSAGIVHQSRKDLTSILKKTFERHKMVAISTYFGEINIYQQKDSIRVDVDQLIPTDLNSFLKRASDHVQRDVIRGGRRSSPYQTRIVMGHKKPDTDAVISSIVKGYMSQYLDSSAGYLSRVNIPVLQGDPNNETNFILKNNGVKQEFFILWERISSSFRLMLRKLSLKIDVDNDVFDDVKYRKLNELLTKKYRAISSNKAKATNSFSFLRKLVKTGEFNRLENRYLNILSKSLLTSAEGNITYLRRFLAKTTTGNYNTFIRSLRDTNDIELLSKLRDVYVKHFSGELKLSWERRFKKDLESLFDDILAKGYPIDIKSSKKGRIERTTWKKRLLTLQGILVDKMKEAGLTDSPKIRDMGCSNGITTLDLDNVLNLKGVENASIEGLDIAMEYFEVTDKNGNKVFLDAFGNLLQVSHGGKVYPHDSYDLRILFANVFEKNDIVDVRAHNIVSPEAAASKNTNVSFATGDLYKETEEKVDVITAFDVLKIYYNKNQINDSLVKMGNNLNDGGLLMRGNRYTNGYTSYAIYQRKGDKLVLMKRSGHIDDDKDNIETEMESELEQAEDAVLSQLMRTLPKEIDLNQETPHAVQTPLLDKERVVSYLQNNYASKRTKSTIGLTDHHMYEPKELQDHEEFLQFMDGFEDHHPIKSSEKELFDKYLPAGWDKDSAYNYEAVGCTSTLLAEKMLKEMPLLLTSQIANLLLSAILSDTMGFYSPTTTKKDYNMALNLAKIAGVDDIEAFFAKQAAYAYTIAGRSTAEVIFEDYKESYTPEAGLAQIFVNGFDEFDAISQDVYTHYKELLEESPQLRFVGLTVTDGKTNDSRFYIVSRPDAQIEVDLMLEDMIRYPALSEAIINSDALRPFVRGELGLDETVEKVLSYFNYDVDLQEQVSSVVKNLLTEEKVEIYMLPELSKRIYNTLSNELEDVHLDVDKVKDIVFSLSRSHSINRDGFAVFYLNFPGALSRKKEFAPPVVAFYEQINTNILPKSDVPDVVTQSAIDQAA